MKTILLTICILFSVASNAQTKYWLKFDSLYISNKPRNAELILENSTKSKTGGFLRNVGNGRTQFAYAIDSVSKTDGNLILHRPDTSFSIPIGAFVDSLFQDGNDFVWTRDGVTYTIPGVFKQIPEDFKYSVPASGSIIPIVEGGTATTFTLSQFIGFRVRVYINGYLYPESNPDVVALNHVRYTFNNATGTFSIWGAPGVGEYVTIQAY